MVVYMDPLGIATPYRQKGRLGPAGFWCEGFGCIQVATLHPELRPGPKPQNGTNTRTLGYNHRLYIADGYTGHVQS